MKKIKNTIHVVVFILILFVTGCSDPPSNTENSVNSSIEMQNGITIPKENHISVQYTPMQKDAIHLADLLCQIDQILYMQIRTNDLSYKKAEEDAIGKEFDSIFGKYSEEDKVKLEDEATKISEAQCGDIIEKLKNGGN